jgi:GtrA-like protein.
MFKRFEDRIQCVLWTVIDFFYPPFKKFFSIQFFRYAFCGGLNMCFDWVLFYVFYHFVFRERVFDLGVVAFTPYIASFVFKFPIVFLTGFWMARHISFSESELRGRVQIIRYLMVTVANIFLVYSGLKLFVEVFNIWPSVANVLISIISALMSFFLNKFFSFKLKNK